MLVTDSVEADGGWYSHVIQAAQHPINLDDRQVNAVSARIELDLRLGAAFTRYQTLSLQTLGGELAERLLSYGKHALASKPPVAC